MSADSLPIDPPAFARALESLPPETLHQRAAEIMNSITHLRYSNNEMMPFAEEGDQDCKEAMFENLVVIGRMNERVRMIREEVERRGLRWMEAEVEDAEAANKKVNGHAEGTGDGVAEGIETAEQGAQPSGRLTDDELGRRLEARLQEGEGAEEEGVHL